MMHLQKTLQGLFELANIPYVGAGVLGAAVGMDKSIMKAVFVERGLPVVNHETVLRREWQQDKSGFLARLIGHLDFPIFVKPSNLGSSVGISRTTDRTELSAAIDLAAEFDRKIVIEEGVASCREIECAVIGNDIFGAPNAGVDGWTFGMPSIWAWQILFWLLGVGMMWFLAYKMEMSTIPDRDIEALVEDIGDTAEEQAQRV